MTWSLRGHPLRSVLVTRLRYLGDIAMTTVVLEVLKRGDVDLDTGYLCEAPYAPLLQGQPHLSRVHAVATRRRGKDARVRQPADNTPAPGNGGTRSVVRELRRQRYDLSVDLFFNPRSAWLILLGGSRWRIGGSRSYRRWLYTHTVHPPDRKTHSRFWSIAPGGLGDHVGRLAPLQHEETGLPFLDWFAAYGGERPLRPRIAAPTLAGSGVATELAARGIPTGNGYFLLAPGATWSTKQWPAVHWTQLARLLADRSRLPQVVLSPPAGGAAYAQIAEALPAGKVALLPAVGLADALRVLAGAALVISVDGGIMHAAVAMGRPTLALFGPTSPDIWFPYAEAGPFRVLATRPSCHPCDRLECDAFVCLPELAPSEVANAACDLLVSCRQAG